MIYAQIGRVDEGRAFLREAEAKSSGIAGTDMATRQRWFSPHLVAQIQHGLEKLA